MVCQRDSFATCRNACGQFTESVDAGLSLSQVPHVWPCALSPIGNHGDAAFFVSKADRRFAQIRRRLDVGS